MSGSDKDKDFLPTKAVRHWAKKYTQNKSYQRKSGGRLVKLERKHIDEEDQCELEDLTQASSLNVFSGIASEPVTRTSSWENLHETNRDRNNSICDLRTRLLSESSGIANSTPYKFIRKSRATRVEDIMSVEDALKRLAVSVEKDNSKLLPPLPYFNGKCEKANASSQTPWIIYDCDEFLSIITDAVNNDKWTEVGKLKTLQDRLLGPARDYWRVRGDGITTLDQAKAYLLRRFPNTDSYTSLTNQIAEFKRRPGETISELATRIQLLYEKFVKLAPEAKAFQTRSMLELFFRGMPEVVRDHVEGEKDYDKAVLKTIQYLERHKEFKMRNKDVMVENTFRSEAKINNVNSSNKNTEYGDKRKSKTPQKRENSNKTQQGAQAEYASINNIRSGGYTRNSQGNFRGSTRRNFRGQSRYRGNFRGNTRGNFQNNRGSSNTYRGYQGYSGGYRNRGFRRGNRGSSRSGFRGSSNGTRSLTCYTCGKVGHTSTTCYARGQGMNRNMRDGYRTQPQSQTSDGHCWTCGSSTHLARDCTQKNM